MIRLPVSSSKPRIAARAPWLAACLYAMAAAGVYAADNNSSAAAPGSSIQFVGSEVGSYESNPLKLASGAKALSGSRTTPELIIQDNTPTTRFNLDTSIDENIFDQSAFNSTDFHGKGGMQEINERWSAGLLGQLDYDTTRTSELTTFGLNLPNVRRFGFGATPQLAYSPNALDKLTLAGSYSSSSYSNSAFTDYELYSVTPGYARNISPNDSLFLQFDASRYQTIAGISNKVDTYGPTAGWQSLINPKFTTLLTVGVDRTSQNSTVATSKSSSLNYVFKGDLDYKGEQNTGNLVASRSQEPFGNGTETLLTSFTASGSHAINELVSLNAGATYQFAQYDTVVGINLKNQYFGDAGFTYHAFKELDFTTTYQYTSEKLTNVRTNINDNTFLVGLAFHPLAWKL